MSLSNILNKDYHLLKTQKLGGVDFEEHFALLQDHVELQAIIIFLEFYVTPSWHFYAHRFFDYLQACSQLIMKCQNSD